MYARTLRSLLTTALIISTAFAWELDSRCPGDSRRLEEDSESPYIHQLAETKDAYMTRSLRGTPAETNRALLSTFQLKMYWEEGFCWQQEWIERRWCMSCQGEKCTKGEHLWIQFCDEGDATQKFTYLPVSGSGGGQLKTETANLCLERVTDKIHLLAECKGSDSNNQIFTGIKTDGSRFHLKPKGEESKCLTNKAHYPKDGELIWAVACSLAENTHTGEWTSYSGTSNSNPDTAGDLTNLKLRNSTACSSRPCDMCQGTCDSDSDCKDNLKCFKRSGTEGVPGCFGVVRDGSDYCFKPSHSISSSAANTMDPYSLKLLSPECSKKHPCDICEGDCDSDDQCSGNLKCFFRDGKSDDKVPGCSGSAYGTKDYCYDPSLPNNNSGKSSSSSSPTTTEIASSTLELRRPDCNRTHPCEICEGDCDSDEQCKGDLKCFMRDGESDELSVPGCSGSVQGTKDYCYDPSLSASNTTSSQSGPSGGIATSSASTSQSGGPELRVPGCSKASPCGLCEGDCDTDDDCAGNLICSLKDGPGSVVGCLGYDKSRTDFCVAP